MNAVSAIARFLEELRGGRESAGADVATALDSLVIERTDRDVAVVSRDPTRGVSLFAERRNGGPPVKLVRMAPEVYGRTPTSDARVRVLRELATLAPRVEVHAPLALTGTYRGRLVIDLPRRAVPAFIARAEPGDRFEGGFVHAFFDDESLILEARSAGLAFLGRRRSWIALAPAADADLERARPFASEITRAAAVIGDAERRRKRDAPAHAVALMRERGARHPARGPIGRSRLRRAIGWVDAAFPTGPNCFRRTLAEIALDAGAAKETLLFGLDVARTGHVAFKDAEERSFDVVFEIPA
jgi:hypothetical protein